MKQSDAALEKAVSLVNRYRGHIEALRGVAVAENIEPAFSFDPRRSASTVKTSALPAKAGRSSRPAAKTAPPASDSDIAYASLSELRSWLGGGVVSAEQIAGLCLQRLAKHQPTLRCVATLTDERALAEARSADVARRKKSAAESLSGIPFGAKDLFDTAGIRTLWGARPYQERPVPASDATAVSRLKSAGACLTAKLSTGELAIGDVWAGRPQYQDGRPLDPMSTTVRGLKTMNPWDPKTGASGSSAGPAAAVAAGLVPFAMGTETGGSIVSPASTCGVTGLRPTYGRVSRHGVMTLRWTLDKIGVLARSV